MPDAGLVKIAVPLEPDRDEQTEHSWAEVETLWAMPLGDDLFEVRNIPWLTDALHNLDVVRCRPESKGGIPKVLGVARPSGHRTIRLTFADAASNEQRESVVGQLERSVGYAERMDANDWAVDVNPGTDLVAATNLIADQERAGVVARSACT